MAPEDVDPSRWFLGVKEVHDDGDVTLWFSTIDGSGDRRKVRVRPTQNVRIDCLIADAEAY